MLRSSFPVAVLVLTAIPVWPQPADAEAIAAPVALPSGERLRILFAQDADNQGQLNPLNAILRGEMPEPEALRLIYTDELDRERLAALRQTMAELDTIPRSALSADERISYDAFRAIKQDELTMLRPEYRALTRVRPFNHFGGLPVAFPALFAVGSEGLRDEAEYRRVLALYDAFPSVLANAIARFREGMTRGVTEPRRTVALMIGQLDALLAQAPEQSQFAAPVAHFPDSIDDARRRELRAAFTLAIREQLRPAYTNLRQFLAETYMPAARGDVGLWAMPGGGPLYRHLVQHETTLEVTPEEIHALGLAEVARIRADMDEVRKELGFSGALDDFFDHVRVDTRFHPRSADELALGYARVAEAVDRELPRFFRVLPKNRLEMAPYPAFQAPYEPGGSYSEGDEAQGRPGVFFYNTSDLPHRYLSGMTTLYLHEGVPGHHFQISRAAENGSLPSFQRHSLTAPFIEGRALYAETLGYDMGLYRDPLQRWGTLDDEMVRAMRLVVDTGIHADRWTREQAIAYMLANSGMARSDAEVEVDRYIAMPGQALSYKVGALTIQRLRDKAQAGLGARFDIRDFHEQILGSGALPLPVLQSKIEDWIARISAP